MLDNKDPFDQIENDKTVEVVYSSEQDDKNTGSKRNSATINYMPRIKAADKILESIYSLYLWKTILNILVKTICIKKRAPQLKRTRKIQSHLVGPNGITAINIGDIRSHSAQRIKISEVTLLMINKISMVSCPCLDIWNKIDTRFSEIFSGSIELPFASLSVVVIGNLWLRGRFIYMRWISYYHYSYGICLKMFNWQKLLHKLIRHLLMYWIVFASVLSMKILRIFIVSWKL